MSLWKPGVILAPEHLTRGIIQEIKDALSMEQAVGLTAWAEARSGFDGRKWVSNPIDAMADIVNVIDNRAKAKDIPHKKVCHARWAFSCWEPKGGPDDPKDADDLAENFEQLMDRSQRLLAGQQPTDKLLGCLALAHGVMVDTLSGATHYYAPFSMVPKDRVPAWAAPPAVLVTERHGHKFYNKVRW